MAQRKSFEEFITTTDGETIVTTTRWEMSEKDTSLHSQDITEGSHTNLHGSKASIPSKDSDIKKENYYQDTIAPKKAFWPSERLPDNIVFVFQTGACVLSTFLMILNGTIVSPALTKIATDLDGIDNQAWIASAFLVGACASQPVAGKFSNLFGRRVVLGFGALSFMIGSLVCALSNTINMLIAGRTIQGTGGGCLLSMSFVIVADIATVDIRPRIQSLLGIAYGIGSVTGPIIGGALVDSVSWRWDFWLGFILSSIVFITAVFFFKEPTKVSNDSLLTKLKSVDWLGVILAMGAICCILIALSFGSILGWKDPHSYGAFTACGISLILLFIVETRIAAEPLLPKSIFSRYETVVMFIYILCVGAQFVANMFISPMLFQALYGVDAISSGIRLIPYMACLIFGAIGSTIALKFIPYTKIFIVIGAASAVLGYGLFLTVNEDSSWGAQAGFLGFCGFALGISQTNGLTNIQAVVAEEDIAVATAMFNFFMFMGAAIGISVYQVLLKDFVIHNAADVPVEYLYVASKYNALKNYLFIRNMPVEYQGPIIHVYARALHSVFLIPLGIAAVAFILSLFIKNVHFGTPAQTVKDPENVEA
ncbi:major facilitator superfamily domain-containing protein [Phycomyces nitens]|nr:major facilitator superfamily domain-containing protein [Phycomyces nitens]